MWAAAGAATAATAILVAYFKRQERMLRVYGLTNAASQPSTNERVSVEATASRIGGHFSLIGTDGERIDSASEFAGKHVIVYFGFTHCPDVCPATLERLSTMLARLQRTNKRLFEATRVCFVTCDVRRDDPPTLARYLADFHPAIVGLTGGAEEVAAVARRFRIYFSANDGETPSDDYIVDHTTLTYLLGADGTVVQHFGAATPVERYIEALEKEAAENGFWARLKRPFMR